jgi:hypothetical protein
MLLEHSILVGGCLGDDLQDVPVLNELAVLVEPEDVDPGVVMVTRPDLVAVQHDVVALGQGALDLDALAGVLRGHSLEVVNEGLLAVANMRVVLSVGSPA